jgi:retinol dehydrogenase-12
MPLLRAGAASSPDGKARIMNTASSAAENITIRVDPATFRDGPARRKQRPFALYAQSKIGNVLVSNELARRYGTNGIVSVALNPGNLRTEMWRHRDATTLLSRMVVSRQRGLFAYTTR